MGPVTSSTGQASESSQNLLIVLCRKAGRPMWSNCVMAISCQPSLLIWVSLVSSMLGRHLKTPPAGGVVPQGGRASRAGALPGGRASRAGALPGGRASGAGAPPGSHAAPRAAVCAPGARRPRPALAPAQRPGSAVLTRRHAHLAVQVRLARQRKGQGEGVLVAPHRLVHPEGAARGRESAQGMPHSEASPGPSAACSSALPRHLCKRQPWTTTTAARQQGPAARLSL
jgi:hypothetical protein